VRRSIQIIKWWPIITTFMVMIGLILILFSVNIYSILSPLFGICFFTSCCWYFFSLDFKFCFWHRLFIINLAVISLIVLFDKNVHQIGFIFYVRGLILLCCSTILASASLYFRYGCFEKKLKQTFNNRLN